ncbi:MAG: hypothetical protein EXS18_05800 [Verrucomicrobiae bacterium]|nr:hypothetical protein [Verrucomicrobiae bacterium]
MNAKDRQADAQWRDQCRRQMKRPLAARLKYGFNYVYKPVLDDAPWRSFKTMAEYRRWCANNLPEYLGFKPAQ